MESDELARGNVGGGWLNEGVEADRVCGNNRAMRNFIAAKEPCACDDEGAADVTVVDDPEAFENGGLSAGLPDEEVTSVDGFFREERVGGGGRVMGVGR